MLRFPDPLICGCRPTLWLAACGTGVGPGALPQQAAVIAVFRGSCTVHWAGSVASASADEALVIPGGLATRTTMVRHSRCAWFHLGGQALAVLGVTAPAVRRDASVRLLGGLRLAAIQVGPTPVAVAALGWTVVEAVQPVRSEGHFQDRVLDQLAAYLRQKAPIDRGALEWMSDMLGLSTAMMSRRFRKRFGCGPYAYQRRHRVGGIAAHSRDR